MTLPFGVTTTPTTPPSDLVTPQYRRGFWKEYIQDSGYKEYMGKDTDGLTKPFSIVLENKKGGNTTKIGLLLNLLNRGTRGNSTLVGREEQVNRYGYNVKIEFHRHAVATEVWEEHQAKPFYQVAQEVRPLLKVWSTEQLRDSITDGLAMVQSNAYGTADQLFADPICNPDAPDPALKIAATAPVLNAWLNANVDRIQFGRDNVATSLLPGTNVLTSPATPVNLVAGNFGASLANVATLGSAVGTGNRFGADMLMRMKYKAQQCYPLIRPLQMPGWMENEFVAFVDPDTFEQAWSDPDIKEANVRVRARENGSEKRNPIFKDGDLLYRGVIIRQIPQMAKIDKSLYGTTNHIGRVHFCGAQALAISWGMEPYFSPRKEDDYGMINGVGITEAYGVGKIQFPIDVDKVTRTKLATPRMVDIGMVTGFCCL